MIMINVDSATSDAHEIEFEVYMCKCGYHLAVEENHLRISREMKVICPACKKESTILSFDAITDRCLDKYSIIKDDV